MMGARLLFRRFAKAVAASVRLHPALFAACMAAVLLSLPGLDWGRVECWNLDQMAHQRLRPDYLPAAYLKPPLHSYLHEFLVIAPVNQVMGGWFGIPRKGQFEARVMGSRLLTVAFFAGGVALLYFVVLPAFGKGAAGAVALLYATSSGILIFNRYLSVDSTLLFWMIASFFFSIRAAGSSTLRDAAFAGLFAGLAAAAKYNGVLVAVALPVALWVAGGFGRGLVLRCLVGGGASLLGFAIGNPGSFLDARRFFADFLYNTATTPVYDGVTQGHGYWKFLGSMPEIFGMPGSLLVAVGAAWAVLQLVRRGRLSREGAALIFAALAVAGMYFLTIGQFPRFPTRFALPAAPFLLLLCAPLFSLLFDGQWRGRRWAFAGMALLLIYNACSSVEAGLRLGSDPRMASVRWMRENAWPGATIESVYSPSWKKALPFDVEERQLPTATGRRESFERIFADDPGLVSSVARFEPAIERERFTAGALAMRSPDFVSFSSLVYDWTGDDAVRKFFLDLDEGRTPGFEKVFDRSARERAAWSYPANIDFLAKRMVVVRRRDGS